MRLDQLAGIAGAIERAKRRTRWGIGISLVWIAACIALLAWKHASLSGLTINEWGDFLAGAVAPLAFLWLALGYFQQGDELRQNTEALIAQEQQLEKQAEATGRLVAQYERQAAATADLVRMTAEAQQRADAEKRRIAAPRLVAAGGSWSQNVEIKLRNVGAEAHNITLLDAGGADAQVHPRAVLIRDEVFGISIQRLGSEKRELLLGCTDVYSNPYRFRVTLDGARNLIDVVEETGAET